MLRYGTYVIVNVVSKWKSTRWKVEIDGVMWLLLGHNYGTRSCNKDHFVKSVASWNDTRLFGTEDGTLRWVEGRIITEIATTQQR